jgi:dihydroorotate dehydrogenase (fumarate)
MENPSGNMKDLTTRYLGLALKNPLIVGSCGFTNSVEKIRELAENGAGAVVLKSLFEEQIQAELAENLESYTADYPGATDYIRAYTRGNEMDAYLKLIAGAKKAVDIPVIASINCVSASEWVAFAKSVEQHGADALELNISLLPSDPRMTCEASEKKYVEIINSVSEMISIPIALKMSQYSSALANLVQRLSWTDKVSGFVLFNRYYTPDIDISKLVVKSADLLSTPEEGCGPLRWVALLSGLIEKDLVASTGIHDSAGVVKQLLAGATAVQVVSTIYRNGTGQLARILKGLEEWMEENSCQSLADFRGRLSYEKAADPAVFERTQFMKYYGGLS